MFRLSPQRTKRDLEGGLARRTRGLPRRTGGVQYLSGGGRPAHLALGEGITTEFPGVFESLGRCEAELIGRLFRRKLRGNEAASTRERDSSEVVEEVSQLVRGDIRRVRDGAGDTALESSRLRPGRC